MGYGEGRDEWLRSSIRGPASGILARIFDEETLRGLLKLASLVVVVGPVGRGVGDILGRLVRTMARPPPGVPTTPLCSLTQRFPP